MIFIYLQYIKKYYQMQENTLYDELQHLPPEPSGLPRHPTTKGRVIFSRKKKNTFSTLIYICCRERSHNNDFIAVCQMLLQN